MRTHLGRPERALRLLAVPGSIPPSVVRPFQAQTGCRVTVTPAPGASRSAELLASGTDDGISATGNVGTRLIAEATPLHRGRRTQVWEARITNAQGRLVAKVTQTQMVL